MYAEFAFNGPRDAWKRILPIVVPRSFGFLRFRPLLASLTVLGAYYPKLRKIRNVEKITKASTVGYGLANYWNVIPLILLHIYGVHHLLRCYVRFGGDDFWTTSVDFIRASIAIITSDHLLVKQYDLHQVLYRSLITYPPAQTRRSEHRLALFLTALCWFYMGVWLGFGCYKLSEFPFLANWAETQWYGVNITEVTVPTFVAATADLSIQKIVLNGPTILSISLYVSQCQAVKGRFKAFNESIESKIQNPREVNSVLLRKWRISRCDLYDLVGDMDAVFSPLAFIWTGMFVVGFCAELTRFLEHMRGGGDVKNTVFFVMDFAFLAFWFYLISMIGSGISEESEESISIYHELLSRTTSSEPYFHQEARMLDAQLSTPLVALTGWKFFEVTRGVVTTVIGALLTYIVVIIEMDPGAKKAIKG